MTKRIASLAFFFSVLCGGNAFAAILFTVTPLDGFDTGYPGQTVGWGFSISNDTASFLVVTNSYFCGPGGDPTFTDCTATPYNGITNFGPALGTYTDYIATNSVIVFPHSTFNQSFDPVFQTGVGGYTIDPSAPLYSIDSGNLFVTYQFWVTLAGPQTPGTGDFQISAPVSVEVIPEPATIVLTASALVALGALRRRSYRKLAAKADTFIR